MGGTEVFAGTEQCGSVGYGDREGEGKGECGGER